MNETHVVNWFDVGYQITIFIFLIALISFIVYLVKRKKRNKKSNS
ncbi:UNVERIFIED_ORG: ABC-type multidrug transport system permease subunit [Bacillus sp. B2I3]|nr:ABC-type multidrug transport system permease subunit [Bacillus sp. B2I3]